MSIEDRFWPKVHVIGPTECWWWIGARNDQGYGRLGVGPRGAGMVYAHRFAYELFVGPIPDGLEPDHLCRNPPCVNPSHLEPVTHAENIRRGLAVRVACPHGHPYDEENTYRTPAGHRRCRTCERGRAR